MKGSRVVGVGVGVFAAVFAAVFGALQLDRIVRTGQHRDVVFAGPGTAKMFNASTSPVGFDFREPAKRALQSVVSIQTTAEGEDFFGRHFREAYAQGSGVVVSDGYVVTNNHVVRLESPNGPLADSVSVTFSDGKSADATIVGTDRRSDLAVLKIDSPDAKPIQLGDSSALQPGEWVLAVGNPLGFSNTVSLGIVSSVGRPIQGDDALFVDGIQTDAAINHGNSGGALVDADGNLVGINTSIASTNGGSIGIGFAIPVNRVKEVVRDIVKSGHVQYGDPGFTYYQRDGILRSSRARRQIQNETGSSSPPPESGVIVQDVAPGGPAARAGIKPLDIVTAMDGSAIDGLQGFLVALTAKRPGETVTFKIWSGGKTSDVRVVLASSISD